MRAVKSLSLTDLQNILDLRHHLHGPEENTPVTDLIVASTSGLL